MSLRVSRTLCSLLVAVLAMPVQASEPPTQAVHPPDSVSAHRLARIGAHPRLLANGERWEALRGQVASDARSRALYAALQRQGELLLALGPIDYKEPAPGENILAQLRQYELRILTFGILYRIGGEQRYLDAARALVLDLAGREANRRHYLDAATYTLVLALGLDWLYDHWSLAERANLSERIKSQTLEHSVEQVGQYPFLWADFNWNQICNNGLALGALAIAEREPALARHILNRSLALLPRVGPAYAPDGLYAEGPGYWSYGTLNHLYLIESLRSSLGESFALERLPGFLESAAALDHVTGPTGQFFNFSDNRPARHFSAPVFWFARETGRADLADDEWERLQAALGGDLARLRDLGLALLWLGTEPGAARRAPLNWQARGRQPVATLRSQRGGRGATWVALKGGTANGSHGHMDAGSFVLEAGGVRWAEDPGYEDYLAARRRSGLTHAQLFSYSQDSLRWRHFRLGPDGHNILRFGGAPQRVDGHAALQPLGEHADGAVTARLALASTYAGQAGGVRRAVTLRADGGVHIADRWRAPARSAVAASWQWLTRARASVDGNRVVLSAHGQTLHLTVRQPGVRIEIEEVSELLSERFDAPLPGYRRIVVHTTTRAGRRGALDVTARLVRHP